MQAAAVTRGPFAITHKAGRSMLDSSTRSGIKEAGLPGQDTVTPAIFCRSRRLAETLVSISCTRVLGKLISVQLSTTVSAAAIHTSSCAAVVDEHHTGHQLQELHKAGSCSTASNWWRSTTRTMNVFHLFNARPRMYVQQQVLDSTLLNSHHA
ncbi:unnamed protein product [Sphagnum troendelagicum]|uniref:Uncharacterized protein n=1 Tax=Sphagnum troendelagicum TaxID=128251 RepID=A0ABP0TS98_9BRYO